MTKYYGIIGYVCTVEGIDPETGKGNGIWTNKIEERFYFGDVLEKGYRSQAGENINNNKTIGNRLSIVADSYAYQNFHAIRYAEFMGTYWNVTNITVEHPRLILSLGEVYNGKQNKAARETVLSTW